MSETGLPVMFHSGVGNITHISGANNRPAALFADVRREFNREPAALA